MKFQLLCLSFLGVASAAARGTPSISVGKPFVLAAHDTMNFTPDASFTAVKKSNGEYNFWGGARSWTKMSSEGGILKATKRIGEVKLSGYPCPKGYSNPCLLDSHATTNVGIWPANVYNIGGHEILMFVHLEFRYHGRWNVRHALVYSKDDGDTFQWVDYIAAPAGKCGTVESLSSSANLGCVNMGLCNYIIKDGYFQSYFQDAVPPYKGGAGSSSQKVAVVRAKVDDVVAAARQLKGVAWLKYYKGAWSEPGLGGDFTPINLPAQGYMHGDAIYVKEIDQYAILMQSGDKQHMNLWRKNLIIAFSPDGITWSQWQHVYDDGQAGDVMYPSLMSYGPDNEVAGKTFAAVYDYSPCHPRRKCAQFNAVNITVTMDSSSSLPRLDCHCIGTREQQTSCCSSRVGCAWDYSKDRCTLDHFTVVV